MSEMLQERSYENAAATLTPSSEVSHVSPHPTPAGAKAQTMTDGYGPNTIDLFASYCRASSSWKTQQDCLFEGLDLFSETWPREGTMRNGQCFRLPTSARLTFGKESSYWPTPQASDAFRLAFSVEQCKQQYLRKRNDPRLKRHGCRVLADELAHWEGRSQTPRLTEWMMGFPVDWTKVE